MDDGGQKADDELPNRALVHGHGWPVVLVSRNKIFHIGHLFGSIRAVCSVDQRKALLFSAGAMWTERFARVDGPSSR